MDLERWLTRRAFQLDCMSNIYESAPERTETPLYHANVCFLQRVPKNRK